MHKDKRRIGFAVKPKMPVDGSEGRKVAIELLIIKTAARSDMIDTGIPDTYQIRSGDGLSVSYNHRKLAMEAFTCMLRAEFLRPVPISETLYIVINASGSLELI